jgi:hypothetical protein
MSMAYIREYYGVPAKRGARILYDGDSLAKFIMGFMYHPKPGTVVAAKGNYIRVRFDSNPKEIVTLHPTWNVRYL